jgi:hypothetical protein
MPTEPPAPPAELSIEIIQEFENYPPAVLRDVADYAEQLAEFREQSDSEDDVDEQVDDSTDRPDDLPDEVPAKATITIKEINDNRYYYWQWREGDKIKSKYKSPVNPDE